MAASNSAGWHPASWRSKEVAQPVEYGAQAAGKLEGVLAKLRSLPPIVTQQEVG